MNAEQLSPRAYSHLTSACSWEEIWEAGPYYDRISELLEDAQEYAIFAGWQIDSRILMKKPSRPRSSEIPFYSEHETLREKILRICNDKPHFQFYFLLWDHAYFYVFEREPWQGRIWENVHPRAHFVFDNKHTFGGSHHEKLIVIDGKIALCGGIDLCNERWDTPQHLYIDPRRSLNRKKETHGPYHDLAVQVSGSVCKGIQHHLMERWQSLSSIPFPPLPSFSGLNHKAQTHRIYLSRTVADADKRKTPGIREIEFLFRELIFSAQRRIIMEGQYFWSRILNDILLSKIQQMRGKDFEIILILAELRTIKSLSKKMMPFELSLIKKLETAAKDAGVRFKAGSPYVLSTEGNHSRYSPRPVYIHSKVLIIDDRFLGIGSANFADRALRVDTELHLTLEATHDNERLHIQKMADQVLQHWNLGASPSQSIHFRSYLPNLELGYLRRNLEGSWKVAWEKFFDPSMPWLYPIQSWTRKKIATQRSLFFSSFSLFWILGIFLAGLVSECFSVGNRDPKLLWVYIYFALQSSVWLLPIPLILISLISTFHLGFSTGVKLTISALWVGALLGYMVIRMFPGIASIYYKHIKTSNLSEQLKKRDFSVLLALLLDPRISLHKKIACQGLTCIPFPWFFLGTLVILPAFLYFLIRFLHQALAMIVPVSTLSLHSQAGLIVISILTLGLWKNFARLWKNAD